jgi:hypothetical protein
MEWPSTEIISVLHTGQTFFLARRMMWGAKTRGKGGTEFMGVCI